MFILEPVVNIHFLVVILHRPDLQLVFLSFNLNQKNLASNLDKGAVCARITIRGHAVNPTSTFCKENRANSKQSYGKFLPVTTSNSMTFDTCGPYLNAWPPIPAFDRVPPTVRYR